MEKGYSTLLVYDLVLPETGVSLRSSALNLQMMCLFAGMERTESQWRAILGASGLELEKVWSSPEASEFVIEARLV